MLTGDEGELNAGHVLHSSAGLVIPLLGFAIAAQNGATAMGLGARRGCGPGCSSPEHAGFHRLVDGRRRRLTARG